MTLREAWKATEYERARLKRCRECNVLIERIEGVGWFWQRGQTRRGAFSWPIEAADDFLEMYRSRKLGKRRRGGQKKTASAEFHGTPTG